MSSHGCVGTAARTCTASRAVCAFHRIHAPFSRAPTRYLRCAPVLMAKPSGHVDGKVHPLSVPPQVAQLFPPHLLGRFGGGLPTFHIPITRHGPGCRSDVGDRHLRQVLRRVVEVEDLQAVRRPRCGWGTSLPPPAPRACRDRSSDCDPVRRAGAAPGWCRGRR